MELALYDEERGYYSRNLTDIGPRGDFSTAASMSELPARRLIQHWRDVCRTFGRNLPIIEIGGGTAGLALSVYRNLGFFERLRVRYYMVEKSPALRSLQSLALGNFARVFPDMQRALKHTTGRAFIFCNELPDAFPVRRFVYRDGTWQELGLCVQNNGTIAEIPRVCPSLPASSAFSRWAREGQIIEVNDAYHRWYTSWQPFWKLGCFVTIDYGAEVENLYYRRPQGTLRGYKAHTLLSVPELPALAGHCDITADVNFTDLLELARRYPGDTVQLLTQREYFLPCVRPDTPADTHLVQVPGAGDHNLVLIQNR